MVEEETHIQELKPRGDVTQIIASAVVTIMVIVGICFAVNLAMQRRAIEVQEQTRQLEEQKLQWLKENIRALKSLSVVGQLSMDEHIRMDDAGNDVEKLRQVLMDIHQERVEYWTQILNEVPERRRKLSTFTFIAEETETELVPHCSEFGCGPSSTIERPVPYDEIRKTAAIIDEDESQARDNITAYSNAQELIRAWTPISFEEFLKHRPKGE